MGRRDDREGRWNDGGKHGDDGAGLQASSLQGLVVFTGPGSFTGLRIGISTMNAMAYAQNIPIVGVGGENWLLDGIKRLKNHENDKIVTPNYGREPNITKSKK
jgi:tRNA threonylcarbamoyladenosine biosynthesis protein TsaB